MRINKFAILLIIALLISGCNFSGPDADAIQTAIAETEESDTLRKIGTSLAEATIAAAAVTDTLEPSATFTDTPIPSVTSTPEPTSTPVPPEGKAYMPDFNGMEYQDAIDILEEMGSERWIYVVLINMDIPEWEVFDQDPEAGTLVDLNDDRLKIIVGVHKFTPTPKPKSKSGQGNQSSNPCGSITYQGVCVNGVCYWCENNELWYWDCNACGGICGWSDVYNYYTCFCP